jgi:hypothetical protein
MPAGLPSRIVLDLVAHGAPDLRRYRVDLLALAPAKASRGWNPDLQAPAGVSDSTHLWVLGVATVPLAPSAGLFSRPGR